MMSPAYVHVSQKLRLRREHVAVMSHAVLFVSKAATPTKWMVTLQKKSQNSWFQMQDKLTAAQTPVKDK